MINYFCAKFVPSVGFQILCGLPLVARASTSRLHCCVMYADAKFRMRVIQFNPSVSGNPPEIIIGLLKLVYK